MAIGMISYYFVNNKRIYYIDPHTYTHTYTRSHVLTRKYIYIIHQYIHMLTWQIYIYLCVSSSWTLSNNFCFLILRIWVKSLDKRKGVLFKFVSEVQLQGLLINSSILSTDGNTFSVKQVTSFAEEQKLRLSLQMVLHQRAHYLIRPSFQTMFPWIFF